MAQAKTVENYRQAWQTHIRELQSVFLDAELPIAQWYKVQNILTDTVRIAANKLTESGHFEEMQKGNLNPH